MNTTVIYHSADFDGIFCREIAKKFIPDATLIGWNFGEPQVVVPEDHQVYILDLPPECLQDVGTRKVLIWIDHHKTSIEKWGTCFPGFQLDGVAACRLAWQYFTCPQGLGTKEGFLDRFVNEPWSVRLAGEYDIWDKRDPDAETLQYGLRVVEPDWEELLGETCEDYISRILQAGRYAQLYAQKQDASICKARSWLMDWEGLRFLCINTARFNSLFFATRDTKETGHDALLGFCFDGIKWTVSLYHSSFNKSIDLSEIAKKYNGGGHRGACGFTCEKLPFNL